MIQDTCAKGLLAFFGIALVLIAVTPLLYPYGTFVNLDGSAGLLDHDWGKYGAGGIVYAIGDMLCHQEAARSFFLNGSQLAFCIRDVGLLIGLIAGLVMVVRESIVSRGNRRLFIGIALLIPTAAEYAYEHLFDVDLPELRFILALVSGFGAAMILGYALYKNAGQEALL
ncbi:MAG: DUF2085 domain-containing protein [Candidatus Methanomethylophilaceae archaeon]|nr:DUF2085 domain-containing protein [Candidatus Methanomethylophilaceae archaeon]